jgi:hypothetical protein
MVSKELYMEYKQQKKEHPELPDKYVWKISGDHIRLKSQGRRIKEM